MTKLNPKFAVPVLATFFCIFPKAFAVNSVNVQTFNPSTSDHFVFLEDGYKSEWPKTATFYFGANYNYLTDPLVALDATQSTKAYNIIDSIQTLDLFFGFKASNNLALFVGVPIDYINFSDDPAAPAYYQLGSSTALGDVKIEGKLRITDDASPTSIALIPEFHLPTGNTGYFVSDASAYIGLRAAIERQFDNGFVLVGNLGFAVASNAIYQDPTFVSGIDYRKRFTVGIGGFLPFSDAWGMSAEFNNISPVPFDAALNPNDAYLGLRYAANESLAFTGGASLTQLGGPGGTNYRFVAGIRYTLFEAKKQKPAPVYAANTTLPLPKATPYPTPLPTPFPSPIAVIPTQPRIIDSTPHAVMHTTRIEVLSPITFEHNSYKLMPDSKQTLDDVASLMKNNKSSYKKVLIDGHTSESGTDKYNLRLSLARAKSVKSYLVSQGVPASVLQARGFGKRNPKVPKSEPYANDINRRVEFIIVK